LGLKAKVCKPCAERLDRDLFNAVKANDCERVRALISSGADINAKRGEGVYDSRGRFLLGEFRDQCIPGDLIAAITADGIEVPKAPSEIESLNELLSGSSLHSRLPGISLCQVAEKLVAQHGLSDKERRTLNRLVLEAAYPLKCPKEDCWTPLHEGAYYGRVEAVRLLLAAGAKTEERNRSGMTPLHYAAGRNHIEVVKVLIAGGADINAKTGFGPEAPLGWETALHTAAENQNVEMVRVLLAVGADKQAENVDHATPINYARNSEVVRLLAGDVAVEARISSAKKHIERIRAALASSLKKSPFLDVVDAMGFRFPNTSDKRRDVMIGPTGRLLVQYTGGEWDPEARLSNVSFTSGATGERTTLVANGQLTPAAIQLGSKTPGGPTALGIGKCTSQRTEGHTWDGCKCSACGETRDQDHYWDEDCKECKCTRCGKLLDHMHRWEAGRCVVCGQTLEHAFFWTAALVGIPPFRRREYDQFQQAASEAMGLLGRPTSVELLTMLQANRIAWVREQAAYLLSQRT
jgi:hypothetical protein